MACGVLSKFDTHTCRVGIKLTFNERLKMFKFFRNLFSKPAPLLVFDTPCAGSKGHRTFINDPDQLGEIKSLYIGNRARKGFLAQGHFSGVRVFFWEQENTAYRAVGHWVVQEGDSARESVEVVVTTSTKLTHEELGEILTTFPTEERCSAEHRQGLVLESELLQSYL